MIMALQTARPGAKASVRNIRVSAFKARPVLRLIQGESYGEAIEILKFCERGAADVITKCLLSAAANAEHNEGIDPEELFVFSCFADEGPTMRRWRPRARGRATRIHKRTSHITIQLVRYTPEELAERAARESTTSAAAAEARRRRVAASRGEDEALEDDALEDEAPEDAEELEGEEALVDAEESEEEGLEDASEGSGEEVAKEEAAEEEAAAELGDDAEATDEAADEEATEDDAAAEVSSDDEKSKSEKSKSEDS